MDPEQFNQQLFDSVSPMVVAIHNMSDRSVCVGTVLHKSATTVFILTRSGATMKNKRQGQLSVQFQDNVQMQADVLIQSNLFSVLCTTGTHASSRTIQFRSEPFGFSEAFCVVPKSFTTFHHIQGSIPRLSCEAYDVNGTLSPTTRDYFLFICHHENQEIINPAPVFHEDRDVDGFVVADCYAEPTDEDEGKRKEGFKIDIHAKICIKATAVEAWLKEALGEHWKGGLESTLNQLNSARMTPEQTSVSRKRKATSLGRKN